MQYAPGVNQHAALNTCSYYSLYAMVVLSTINFSEVEDTCCDCSASTTAVAEAWKAAVLKTVEGELQLLRATFGRLEPGQVTVQLYFLLLVKGWQGASKSAFPNQEKPF